jgi:hypothetical protein
MTSHSKTAQFNWECIGRLTFGFNTYSDSESGNGNDSDTASPSTFYIAQTA